MALSSEKSKALKAACNAVKQKPHYFFYCPEGGDGAPALLIGKNISEEVKELKKTAKKKQFVRGKVARADSRLQFLTDTPTVGKFDKNLKTVFGAAVPELKKAEIKPLPAAAPADEAPLVPTPRPAPAPAAPTSAPGEPVKPATDRKVLRGAGEIGFSYDLKHPGCKFSGAIKLNLRINRTVDPKAAKLGSLVEEKIKHEFSPGKGFSTKLQSAFAKLPLASATFGEIPGTGLKVAGKIELALLDAEYDPRKHEADVALGKISFGVSGSWTPPDAPGVTVTITGQVEGKLALSALDVAKLKKAGPINPKPEDLDARLKARVDEFGAAVDSCEAELEKLDKTKAGLRQNLADAKVRLDNQTKRLAKNPQSAELLRKRAKELERIAKLEGKLRDVNAQIDKVSKALQKALGKFKAFTGKLNAEAQARLIEKAGKKLLGKTILKFIPVLNVASTIWDLCELGQWIWENRDEIASNVADRFPEGRREKAMP